MHMNMASVRMYTICYEKIIHKTMLIYPFNATPYHLMEAMAGLMK